MSCCPQPRLSVPAIQNVTHDASLLSAADRAWAWGLELDVELAEAEADAEETASTEADADPEAVFATIPVLLEAVATGVGVPEGVSAFVSAGVSVAVSDVPVFSPSASGPWRAKCQPSQSSRNCGAGGGGMVVKG
jgi:hypothetical protein